MESVKFMNAQAAAGRYIGWLLFLLIGPALAGCAGLRPHFPPPAQVEAQVEMPGMPGVRAWGDEFSPVFQKDFIESVRQEERSGLFKAGDTVSILAISGGGGDGAFGAGLLCGWTAAGNRPSFKLVTGVSTGALTAPFAFLGARLRQQAEKGLHDHQLQGDLQAESLLRHAADRRHQF
ncbi:patatin-like phospholipase family protein [Methylocaldum sp.]|uniref:patatin-like phospholipase family protein n=1 Tax=Methylocaldum sp. TaxID=1969727 RepID=UPI002D25237E|nr:patatin-like phospholipase family protein [Methylocaldum sp.]HYE36917.1 patatin-like phospholipase family protein [Methylocaldum sp.]